MRLEQYAFILNKANSRQNYFKLLYWLQVDTQQNAHKLWGIFTAFGNKSFVSVLETWEKIQF